MARQLYIDSDGVVADFDARVRQLTGKWPAQLSDKEMWTFLDTVPRFYRDLPLMPRAKDLWKALKRYNPTFLSGVPLPEGEMVTAPQDKRVWFDIHFGPQVPLITCTSKDKANYCKPGDVLVDDRIGYKPLWEKAGGVFIRYFPIDADSIIERVHKLMIDS